MPRKAFILAVFLGFSALPALAQQPAHASHPDGSGDPDVMTCRTPQVPPGSRLPGPEVCKLNSQWALLRKNGEDISADGKSIIPDPKGSNVTPMSCSYQGGGASNGGQLVCHSQ
ncbi:MAG TPA: hypothetical protein VFI23_08225 [Rhizomicrobium sp.]|nr:hypothetical protein [Rhizomicrobium sp.]